MTSQLDPYREFRDWLADGPTAWSDQSVDAVIHRIAVTPQQRRSQRAWQLSPRRALFAVAGLAAVVIIVGVAWAVLSGQLLPTHLPPATTPEPSIRASDPRSDGNSALLDDGRVLVVSGDWEDMGERVSPLAQVWDPVTASLSTTGRLIEGRVNSTATALYDGRVLVVGGFGGPYAYGSSALASAELWDATTESFAAAGSAAYPRVGHTATLLLDGRVLIIGGSGAGASVSAEIWDPASGAFTALTALKAPERIGGHTATLLDDGRVLIVGGTAPGFIMPLARLWDPIANEFYSADVLAQERIGHTATLLEDGRVLIVGGRPPSGGPALTSAEVWDPASGEFTEAGMLREGRANHSATRLADGRVFFFGGIGGSESALASVEFWDPTTATFGAAAPLPEPLFEPSTVPLPDGRHVLVAGMTGDSAGPTSAVMYDAGAAAAPQSTPGATPVCHWDLPGDVMAEVERAAVELGVSLLGPNYAAAQGDIRLGVEAFAQAGCGLIVARVTSPEREASAVEAFAAHPEQRGVVFGSERYQGRELPNVLWVSLGGEATGRAVFDAIQRVTEGTFQGGTLRESGFATPAPPFSSSRPPAEGPFSTTGLLAQNGGSGDSVLLPDGRVLVLNRSLGMLGTSGTKVFDPVSGTAELTGQPEEDRFESTATLLRDGRVLVVGGVDSRPDIPPLTPISSAETWDPATESFTATGSMADVRRNHTATLLADGRVLVVGGATSASAEVWDPATGLFSPTGPLAQPREGHTTTVLPDGRVLVVGGSTGRPGQTPADVSSAEVWDPATSLFSPAGELSEGRGGSATLLHDGRVLIVGNQSADIWDPATNSFSRTGDGTPAAIRGVAVLVPDGRVLFFSDDSAEGSGSVAVAQWDPASGVFSAAPSMTVPISPEMAAVLDDGRVLVTGFTAAVVYDPGGDE